MSAHVRHGLHNIALNTENVQVNSHIEPSKNLVGMSHSIDFSLVFLVE